MRFTKFEFENFKGIEKIKIDLQKNPKFNVHALVGLNESGKTTILEAINYFTYKLDNLEALDLDHYKIEDIHQIIPIGKRDNFNDTISVSAEIELSSSDENKIKEFYKKNNIIVTKDIKTITYHQYYKFENSKHIKSKDRYLWNIQIVGKKKRGTKIYQLPNDEALIANELIKKMIPSILYFPNFLFEFPEKIYLDEDYENEKNQYYLSVIQDILDSLENDLNIKIHLYNRAISKDEIDNVHLNSVLDKMSNKVTRVIFDSWNHILNKDFGKKEITIKNYQDTNGPYLQFNIRDVDGLYLINERSLGFRWFFVFILLTQFRSFRKENNNALFLFDEPASNLHSAAQKQLLDSFSKLENVIYTTHSHYLINPKWLESTFVVVNEGLNYDDNIDDYSSNKTNIKSYMYREFVAKYPSKTTYFQPILDVLDYAPSNLEMVPEVIITEGKNDYYTLNYYQNIIKKKRNKINVMPGTSASSLEYLISLNLGWGNKFVILLDADEEGNIQKERYIDIFGVKIESLINTISEINDKFKKKRTEDLFTNEDKMKIINRCYPEIKKYNKSLFNKAIQELLVNEIKVNISKESQDNLEEVTKYLYEKVKKI
ncbi:AAA family ATPase [Marispirochaeta aestuarii]|uniref:ATP-dependent nuclease n=1 Tax=Marispirochaeta aestuarii TaxID=1963862 RepID=UPI0029C63404|nr:AAA family ATPase [Marispirochaeta aestuarii]